MLEGIIKLEIVTDIIKANRNIFFLLLSLALYQLSSNGLFKIRCAKLDESCNNSLN